MKMRKIAWSAVLITSYLSLIVNCSSTRSIWVTSSWERDRRPLSTIVCVDVADRNYEAVSGAVAAWSKALKNWQILYAVKSPPSPECDITIQEVDPDPNKSVTVLGSTDGLGIGRIQLYRHRYETDSFNVTLHELGHAFGAKHLKGTLMNPKLIPGAYECPDVATVLQVAHFNNIDPQMLSWCY